MNTDTAETIRVGDVIMPPERELRLWMRKHIATHNLPESALYLNVTGIYETSDKRGKWLHFKTQYPEIWPGGSYAFVFKARPETPWAIIERKEVARVSELPAYRVYLANGTSYVTSMARNVTLEKAQAYFLGASIDTTLGEGPETFSRCVKVEVAQ